MKNILISFVFIALSISGFSVVADEIRIGYVDLQKALTESKAGKRVAAELEKITKQRRDALAKDERRLKDMQQAYEKDKLLLTESQKQEKQEEFQQKLQVFQKAAAEANRELAEKEKEYTSKAIPNIRAIIRGFALEEKLTLVFEKNEVPALYAIDGPDLTERVIKELDAKN